jgi:type III secretion system YscI/HrpB-like protein
MTAVSLSPLDKVAAVKDALGTPKVGRPDAAAGASQRFSAAMDRAIAGVVPPSAPVKVAQLQAPVSDAGVGRVTDAAAEERARRVLQLDAPQAADSKQNGGDMILDGLQRLRGVFDAQQARISSVMSEPAVDFQTLMKVQMEVVHYSLLVDVTSKMTGKSTQAFDTLLKGQ